MNLDWVPEDVLKEVLEEEKRLRSKKRNVNRRRPTRKDLMEAISKAVSEVTKPHDLPDRVYELLEERGFTTRFTSVKRIWETYEYMVRKGFLLDVLGVMKEVSTDK